MIRVDLNKEVFLKLSGDRRGFFDTGKDLIFMSTDIHTYIENIGGIDKLPGHGVDIHSPSHPVPIGLDADGNPVSIDLTSRRWAHMIVAGHTGFGKTCFLQALQESAELIYPGLIEFLPVESSSEVQKAEIISLQRQEVLSKAGARDAGEYNQKYPEHPMSEIFLLIDGYPEKKFSDRDWDDLNSLVRTGRSLGIQQILTAQSPGRDLELLSTKVCFRSTDAISDRILGSDAATKLEPAHAVIQTPFTEHKVEVFSSKSAIHATPDTRDPLDPKNFLELGGLAQQIMRIPGERNISGVKAIDKVKEALRIVYSPENLTRFNLHSVDYRYYNLEDDKYLWGITAGNYGKLVEILAWFDKQEVYYGVDTDDASDLLRSFSLNSSFEYETEYTILQAILDRAKDYRESRSFLTLAEMKALFTKLGSPVE